MEFLSSEKAVSEVVGSVFILALTVIGVASITLLGVPSIQRLEDMADVKNAEQTFAALDSRVSSAIIGDSPMKTVNLNLGGGNLVVEPNGTGRESYMVIKSVNHTFNIIIPMGKVRYDLGDRTVAYEGGGIWSKYPSGSVMLSPPEFHYDGKTLILPVITVNGSADIAGKGTAAVIFKKNSTLVLFPNATIDINRTNPLNYNLSGMIYLNITSDYYDAWADYARSLLYTGVITDPANHTTNIELKVVPSVAVGNNPISNPISIIGPPTNDTPLDKWSFRLYGNFNSYKWDIRAVDGNKKLIFFIWKGTLTVGYQDVGYTPSQEMWGSIDYPIKNNNDGKGDYIDVDLLSKNLSLNYSDQSPVGANDGCSTRIKNNFSSTDFSWDNIIINTTNANRTQSLFNITQHYLSKLAQDGNILFNQCQSGVNGPDLSKSYMNLGYNATGTLRFLQISEYNINADIR